MVDLGADKKVSTPFPAIVGQEPLKRGLLALAVEDGLGGTLVRGEKGTAKSTAVRAMADLLPAQRAVADCPYGCPPPGADDADDAADEAAVDSCEACRERDDPPVETRPTPLVTLPLGATRDQVVGTLSVADALAGEAEFDPGLLARANRGVLYVDEVNLLDDHLVDVLLDAAAMGTNRVERDGVSVSHPAEFTLIGTMNPEEDELRPQLRDRFDLCVEVTGSDDLDDRVEILDRVVDGGGNGDGDADADRDLREAFADETATLRDRVRDARERRPTIPDGFKRDIAALCRDAGVDGHRADFAVARAARAFAALDGRPKVIRSDVVEAAEYALAHRLRSRPFEDAPDPDEVVDDHFDDEGTGEAGDDADGEADEKEDGDAGREGDESADESGNGDRPGEDDSRAGSDADSDEGSGEETDGEADGADPADADPRAANAPDEPLEGGSDGDDRDGDHGDDDDHADDGDESATPLVPGAARAGVGEATAPDVETPAPLGSAAAEAGGRGDAAPSPEGRGATVRTEPADGTGAVDPAATVRTAAREGRSRPTEDDLQQAVRTGDARTLTVFVADASASMAPAMRAAKGVAMELLKDAYAERDEVALVAVGGDDAETLLPPTDSVSLAARHLKELPSADRTPLPAGLDAATAIVEREDPGSALVVVVSDGRANVADGSPTAATREAARRLGATDASVLVVEAGDSRAGLLGVVREATDARGIPLSALSSDAVADHQ
ncbi:VWA domain-containing protein [Halorubrum gandharaense]